jgi:hypothetical protein
MIPEQFMHALAELVAEAEEAGLSSEMVADELVAMAKAIRECVEE